jgi:5-methylthioadenosine/S-adenosylhomocysteine deaminase
MAKMTEKADLLLRGGTILTLDKDDRVIEKGALAIRSGRIAGIGPEKEIAGRFSARKTLDLEGKIAMPGLINTHAHSAMALLRGVADDKALEEWLRDFIFPLEERFVDEEFALSGSLLACAEMALGGTTTFCDMYFQEKETGKAAEKVGLRAVIGEGIVALGEEEDRVWKRKKALTAVLSKEFAGSSLVSVAVEPHSPYTCSADVLQKAKEFARKEKLLYVIHLAETKQELDAFKKEKEMTPVAYLDSLGVLDADTLCAHCVWLEKGDFALLRQRQVKISHCPQSNMKLGSGIAPVARMLHEGLTVSLGTDSCASNNTLDMLAEMKSAALLGKVAALDPSVLSAREIVRMATIEGAKALGLEGEIGSLEAGKKADIITLDPSRPHLTPVYDYYSHLVYCANGCDVCDSIIDGKLVMENRQLKTVRLGSILRDAETIARRIRPYLSGK